MSGPCECTGQQKTGLGHLGRKAGSSQRIPVSCGRGAIILLDELQGLAFAAMPAELRGNWQGRQHRGFPRQDKSVPFEPCDEHDRGILRAVWLSQRRRPDQKVDLLELDCFETSKEFSPELLEGVTAAVSSPCDRQFAFLNDGAGAQSN